jgi:hypothetical protein
VILGLLLITAAVIFWCLRRRRKLHETQSTSAQSARSWIMRWMHTGGSTTGVSKPSDPSALTGYSAFANDSNITPSTAVSPRSVEAGGVPVYEMLGSCPHQFLYIPLIIAKIIAPHSRSPSNFQHRTTTIPSPVRFRLPASRAPTTYPPSRLAHPVQRVNRARQGRPIIAMCLVCPVCRL